MPHPRKEEAKLYLSANLMNFKRAIVRNRSITITTYAPDPITYQSWTNHNFKPSSFRTNSDDCRRRSRWIQKKCMKIRSKRENEAFLTPAFLDKCIRAIENREIYLATIQKGLLDDVRRAEQLPDQSVLRTYVRAFGIDPETARILHYANDNEINGPWCVVKSDIVDADEAYCIAQESGGQVEVYWHPDPRLGHRFLVLKKA